MRKPTIILGTIALLATSGAIAADKKMAAPSKDMQQLTVVCPRPVTEELMASLQKDFEVAFAYNVPGEQISNVVITYESKKPTVADLKPVVVIREVYMMHADKMQGIAACVIGMGMSSDDALAKTKEAFAKGDIANGAAPNTTVPLPKNMPKLEDAPQQGEQE